MSEISIIRMKKINDMTYDELLLVKDSAKSLIKGATNPRTIQQEKKYLAKIEKRLKEILNGKTRNSI